MTTLYILFAAILIILLFVVISLTRKRHIKYPRVKCRRCGHIFKPFFETRTLFRTIYFGFVYRVIRIRFFLRCPKCKRFSWCSLVEETEETKEFVHKKTYSTYSPIVISFPIAIAVIFVSVFLIGFIAWQYFFGIPKEETSEEKQSEEIVSEDKEVAPKDETADWKIYRNEKYGFEIKYPIDYAIMNGSGFEVAFAPQQAIQYEEDGDYFWSLGIILVEVNDNPNGLSIEDFYDGDPGYNYFGKAGAILSDYPYSEQVQTDIIGGKEVIIISPAGTQGVEYYILSSFNGRLLRIHNRNLPYETSKLMFETFRFLE